MVIRKVRLTLGGANSDMFVNDPGVTSEGISGRTRMRRGDGYIPRWLALDCLATKTRFLGRCRHLLRPARLAWHEPGTKKNPATFHLDMCRAMLWEATLFVAISSLRGGESMYA